LNQIGANQGEYQIQADEAHKPIKNQLQVIAPFQVWNSSSSNDVDPRMQIFWVIKNENEENDEDEVKEWNPSLHSSSWAPCHRKWYF
jgi:hypothetical protein